MALVVVAAAALFGLGVGQLVVVLGLGTKTLFPPTGRLFRALVIPPLLASGVSCISLSWVALTGEDQTVLSANALELLTIYFVSKFFVWWLLICYVTICRWRPR